MTPDHRIYKVPKLLLISLTAINVGIMTWLKVLTDSFWGWRVADLDKTPTHFLIDGIAVLQFVIFAFTADKTIRVILKIHNKHNKKSTVPAILMKVISLIVYFFAGLTAYVLFYDHDFSRLLASVGALGVGVVYLFRDFIADLAASLKIQTDKLIGIGDWIEISSQGGTKIYQIVEIDQRMITLKGMTGLTTRMYNHQFLTMEFVNVSRQKTGLGSRRFFTFELDSSYTSEKVLAVTKLALTYVVKGNPAYLSDYDVFASGLTKGEVSYTVRYECTPETNADQAKSEFLLVIMRFLKAAGISTSQMTTQVIVDENKDARSRLLDSYEYGFLKVLSPDEVKVLARSIKLRYCTAGELVIKKGAQENWMYLVAEGTLEVKIETKSGEFVTVANLWPCDFLGEMSMLTGAARSADVYAKVDSILLQISAEDMAPLLNANPELVKLFSNALAERSAQKQQFSNRDSRLEQIEQESKTILNKILKFFMKSKSTTD